MTKSTYSYVDVENSSTNVFNLKMQLKAVERYLEWHANELKQERQFIVYIDKFLLKAEEEESLKTVLKKVKNISIIVQSKADFSHLGFKAEAEANDKPSEKADPSKLETTILHMSIPLLFNHEKYAVAAHLNRLSEIPAEVQEYINRMKHLAETVSLSGSQEHVHFIPNGIDLHQLVRCISGYEMFCQNLTSKDQGCDIWLNYMVRPGDKENSRLQRSFCLQRIGLNDEHDLKLKNKYSEMTKLFKKIQLNKNSELLSLQTEPLLVNDKEDNPFL
jgi:hypothetical protein